MCRLIVYHFTKPKQNPDDSKKPRASGSRSIFFTRVKLYIDKKEAIENILKLNIQLARQSLNDQFLNISWGSQSVFAGSFFRNARSNMLSTFADRIAIESSIRRCQEN